MKPGISIGFVKVPENFDAGILEGEISRLPANIRKQILVCRHPAGRMRRLVGRLLLQRLAEDSLEKDPLPHLRLNRLNRPFLKGMGRTDFSIAHSGELIICALNPNGRIGADIERIREIKWKKFGRFFPAQVWAGIQNANSQKNRFFDLWTIVEAASKYFGTGFAGLSGKYGISGNRIRFGNKECTAKLVKIHPGYACHVCIDSPEFRVHKRVYENDVFFKRKCPKQKSLKRKGYSLP